MRSKKIILMFLLAFPFLLNAQTDIDTIVKVDTIFKVDTLVRIDTVIKMDTIALLDTSIIQPDTLLVEEKILKTDTIVKVDTIIKVNAIEIKGITYPVCQKFPADICGEYYQHKKGNPKILLNPNGTGYFQRKEMKLPMVNYWIVSNKNRKTEPFMDVQLDGNCFVTVILRYKDEDMRALWGEFVAVEVKIDYYDGYSVIFQENYHKFKK